jgi:hypothetical protein
MGGVLRLLIVEVFTYSTVRSATIYNVKVGLVYRIVQVLLLTYIIGYEFINNRAYQTHDTVSSVVTSKVKGQGFVPINTTIEKEFHLHDVQYFREFFNLKPDVSYRILDTAGKIIF